MLEPLRVITVALTIAAALHCQSPDWRNIQTGRVIPDEGYCDQPYVVVLDDGTWLCVMTTGDGHEGNKGQHVVATRSEDLGRTWTPLVDIEPSDGPVASWAMPVVTPSGRVHVFYSYNGDQVSGRRADMLGWYCTRYSDDGGKTWSARERLPVRVTAADRGNDWAGEHQIFWGIGKPVISDGAVIFGFSKIGRYMLDESEGWFFRSDNLLTERDPSRVSWEMLPDGDHGLRAPEHGSIQSEQNIVPLDGDDLYCMYRTVTGYPCHAYSRDGGRTWTQPTAATYTPGGRRFRHPRACPRVWRTQAGRFLFWFHNNGAKDWAPGTRNPAWIVGGALRDGQIHWSQPELLLYAPDPNVRMSYPDLIEQDGRVWITETQKSIARVHEIDTELLEGLWRQGQDRELTTDGLVLDTDAVEPAALPALPDLDAAEDRAAGWTFELWANASPTGSLVSAKTSDASLELRSTADGWALDLQYGAARGSLETADSGLHDGDLLHVVCIADAGPGILTWVVDGVVCDGGDRAPRGWNRFRTEGGSALAKIVQQLRGEPLAFGKGLRRFRIYDRPLRTAEAIANFHAGPAVER